MSTAGSQGKPYRKLGELLQAAGVIDELQLKSALAHQRQWGGRLGHILLDLHFIDDLTLARTLAEQLGLQILSLRTAPLDLKALQFLPQALAERLLVFPVAFDPGAEGGGVLTVAFSDPTNLAGLDEIRFQTGKTVQAMVATESEVAWAIRRFYYGEEDTEPLAPPVDAPIPDRAGLFGDGTQMLSSSEEEEQLVELEPIPSDSQIGETSAPLAEPVPLPSPRVKTDPLVDFFAVEDGGEVGGAPLTTSLSGGAEGGFPLSGADLGVDPLGAGSAVPGEDFTRSPTRPDMPNPFMGADALVMPDAPARAGPAVVAELDAAFERTFTLDGGADGPSVGVSLEAPAPPGLGAPEPSLEGLSGQALQALIRILVRKGLVSEVEILDELQAASVEAGQSPPTGERSARR